VNSRPPRHNLHKDAVESPDPEDLELLEQFSSDIKIDEIAFEHWRDLHNELDLIYHLRLTESELRDGCEKTIIFSRTLRESNSQRQRPVREKTEKLIRIPPNARDGQVLILTGQGDLTGTAVGDLRVIIQVN